MDSTFKSKWYTIWPKENGNIYGRIQSEKFNVLPIEILRMAYDEYAAQGHGGQSFERIQERGGFSAREVISLLADSVLRACNVDTRW